MAPDEGERVEYDHAWQCLSCKEVGTLPLRFRFDPESRFWKIVSQEEKCVRCGAKSLYVPIYLDDSGVSVDYEWIPVIDEEGKQP